MLIFFLVSYLMSMLETWFALSKAPRSYALSLSWRRELGDHGLLFSGCLGNSVCLSSFSTSEMLIFFCLVTESTPSRLKVVSSSFLSMSGFTSF